MSSEQDRELLELAAKAVGLAEDWPAPRYEIQWNGYGLWCSGMGDGLLWNPLTSDADALRLVIKLNLNLPQIQADAGVSWDSHDRCSVTRRAITRAAAALAKGEGKV